MAGFAGLAAEAEGKLAGCSSVNFSSMSLKIDLAEATWSLCVCLRVCVCVCVCDGEGQCNNTLTT